MEHEISAIQYVSGIMMGVALVTGLTVGICSMIKMMKKKKD